MSLPIRVRLTLVSGALMAVVIAVTAATLYLRLRADLVATVDNGLRSRAETILTAAEPSTGSAGRLLDADEAFAQLITASGALDESTPGLEASLLTPDEVATALDGGAMLRDARISASGESLPARLLTIPTDDGRLLVVGASTEDQDEALARLLVLLLVGGPVTVLLASGIGWLVAGAALRPVERLRREAELVSGSDPGQRLPVPGTGDELARLGRSLNGMLERLEDAVTRERRFVDNASHELRTPLANLKAELDLAQRSPRTTAELRDAVVSAAEETDRLTRLAEDLLVLARAHGGRLPIRREPVDLGQLAREVVAGFSARAGEARLTVTTSYDEPVPADPTALRQALGNLVDNAMRQAPTGTVTVSVSADGDTIRVSVSDTGEGFPPEFLPHALEPFTRADTARARDHGGAGLGLAIVDGIVRAHGGSVEVANHPGGASVTLVLPR